MCQRAGTRTRTAGTACVRTTALCVRFSAFGVRRVPLKISIVRSCARQTPLGAHDSSRDAVLMCQRAGARTHTAATAFVRSTALCVRFLAFGVWRVRLKISIGVTRARVGPGGVSPVVTWCI